MRTKRDAAFGEGGGNASRVEVFFDKHPFIVSMVIIAMAVVVGVIGYFCASFNILNGLDLSNRIGILAAVASVSAILAGFSSVIISYLMSADSKPMRQFRISLGNLGNRNWKSMMWSPFVASLSSIIGMLVAGWFEGAVALGLLLWSVLEIIHGFTRTVHIQTRLFELRDIEDGIVRSDEMRDLGRDFFGDS